MTKRVYIVHCWDGSPDDGWYPWLKRKLEEKGFDVTVPAMTNSEEPQIEAWLDCLKKQVGEIDEDTYFVAHSIGCQTVLRYLEGLEENKRAGGAVFVAGWLNLIVKNLEEGSYEIAEPWIKSLIV